MTLGSEGVFYVFGGLGTHFGEEFNDLFAFDTNSLAIKQTN